MNQKTAGTRWSEVVQVLLTNEMKAELVQMARDSAVSQSAFARALLKDAITRERRRRRRLERQEEVFQAEVA